MPTPSLQFFLSFQDLTGVTSVTAAQLNNILLAGSPFGDKGMIIWTTDSGASPNVPDVVTYPVFSTCIWGRIQPTTSLVSLYFWNPNTGSIATYAKWQNIIISGLPTGSITGSMIAASTITGVNIAATTITDSLIATVSGAKIVGNTIPLSAFVVPGASGKTILSISNDGTTIQWNAPPILYTGAFTFEAGIGASPNTSVIVNPSGNGYQYATHRVLQCATYSTLSGQSSTTSSSFVMTTGNSDLVTGFGSVGIMAFTPISNVSTIRIRLDAAISNDTNGDSTVVGIFDGNNLLNSAGLKFITGTLGFITPLSFAAIIANAATTQRNFSIRFGNITGGTAQIGNPTRCVVSIDEYI